MNTPAENIVSTLKGKKALFIENDNGLYYGLDQFERILKENNIEHTILFDVSNKPIETVLEAITKHDCIVFQTQWKIEISNKLLEYVKNLKDKKIIVEVYINEPTWYYKKQHGSKHDVYIYNFNEGFPENESFYKLTNKPYWEYKNQFNK